MKHRFRAVALDELDEVPWKGSMTMRPVRGELGVRAFGVAGFTAQRAGELVVEPHSETDAGRGHEELYFVVRGRARFTLDGEDLDAPAGTFVFVGEPAVHRQAVAVEPGTAVLAFGGEPGFVPAGEEYMARVRALIASDPARARAIADQGLDELPDSPGAWCALALALAASGHEAEARRWLADAVERVPALRDEARRDRPLAELADA